MSQTPDNEKSGCEECEGVRSCIYSVGAYPLLSACAGKSVKVVQFKGGRNLASKMAGLGIIPGAMVSVVVNCGGPMIIEVKGSRLSLGQGMAQKIVVKDG